MLPETPVQTRERRHRNSPHSDAMPDGHVRETLPVPVPALVALTLFWESDRG